MTFAYIELRVTFLAAGGRTVKHASTAVGLEYGSDVRWDELFAALEYEYDAMDRQTRDADIADRTRSAQAQTSWLMRSVGAQLTLRVRGAGLVQGRGVRATPAWLLLRGDNSTETVVATSAVVTIAGLAATAASLDARHERMGWTHAWRVLSRDRSLVRVTCVDGAVVSGVAQTVGLDYVSLRAYDAGRPTGADEVAVAYAAIATVTVAPR